MFGGKGDSAVCFDVTVAAQQTKRESLWSKVARQNIQKNGTGYRDGHDESQVNDGGHAPLARFEIPGLRRERCSSRCVQTIATELPGILPRRGRSPARRQYGIDLGKNRLRLTRLC